jgi:hypothetical protein
MYMLRKPGYFRKPVMPMSKKDFVPISMEECIEQHMESNPKVNREEVAFKLNKALEAYKNGAKCIICGGPIWVAVSAFGENMCFTCVTGEVDPSDDYEIDEACY